MSAAESFDPAEAAANLPPPLLRPAQGAQGQDASARRRRPQRSSTPRYHADRELVYPRPLSLERYRVVYGVWDVWEQRRLPGEFPSPDDAVDHASRLNAEHTARHSRLPR